MIEGIYTILGIVNRYGRFDAYAEATFMLNAECKYIKGADP